MRPRLVVLFALASSLLSGCIVEDVGSRATPTANSATIVRPPLASLPPAQAPSPAPSPSPTAEGRTYTVREGDSLSSIAERLYGNSAEWRPIYEANRDRLVSPEALQVGMTLRIPPLPSQTTTPR